MAQQVLGNTWAQVDAAVDIVQASGLGADLTLVAADNPEIKGVDADGVLTVTCDAVAAAGGNIRLFGSGHATQANDVELRSGATLALHYDDSASLIDLQANALQTTGTAALGTTTLSGDLVISNGNGAVIGHSALLTIGGIISELQVLGTSSADGSEAIGRFSADTSAAQLSFVKSRAAIGAFATIVTGDVLGVMNFYADDGTDYATEGAQISVTSEGTIAGNRIPTKMELKTGTDAGPSVVTTALTLSSAQLCTLAAGLTVSSGVVTLPTGAVGAPSVNLGSATTGLFASGADILNITNAGVETMEFSAANTIGIGRASDPTVTVDIQGAGIDTSIIIRNAAGFGMFQSGAANLTSATGANAGNTMMIVQKDSTTSRSINAAGTINASGADYAEYEFKAPGCGSVAAGDIVGFDINGLLTDKFSDALSFAIKSSDPAYVGGDRWGSEAEIGARPEIPKFIDPGYPDVKKPRDLYDEPTLDDQEPIDPGPAPIISAIRLPEETDESYLIRQQAETEAMALWAAQRAQYVKELPRYEKATERFNRKHEAWEAAEVIWSEETATYNAAYAEYADTVAALKATVADDMPVYDAALATWEAGLETARQSVDRIAYAGKVPCNITGGAVGDHIIPVSGAGDSIDAVTTAAPTAAQYRVSVGRIKAIDATNRVFVIVKMG